MRFNKARYITCCQQALVTATVSALALTAAGVVRLDIVKPPAEASAGAADFAPAISVAPTAVADHSVAPKLRAVSLTTNADKTTGAAKATAPAGTPSSAPSVAPSTAPAGANARSMAPARPTISGLPVVLTSAPEQVSGYATVGVTWDPGHSYSETQLAVQIRTLVMGKWSSWQALQYHDDHMPDGSEAATAKEHPGTDPLVIGTVERVQMRIATYDGVAPKGLRFDLIDPGATTLTMQDPAIDTNRLPASDATATSAKPIESTADLPPAPGETGSGATTDTPGTQGGIALSAMKLAPKPYIYSRAQWGADEKLREQGPPLYGTIETGFIHHTVNANNYTEAQVPALIRGIYAYHVLSRGWRDIGYNFLIDRFGRIWEGRWGGVDRPVVGAHTLGYNDVSFAASAIGNYDIAQPSAALIAAEERLFAWKLSLANIWANASGLHVKSRILYAINGHRDVNQTECPGKYLYAKIPAIRVGAYAIQKAAQSGSTPAPTPTPTPTPTPPPSSGSFSPTMTPKAAVAQPGGMRFPSSLSVLRNGRPGLVMQSSDGRLSVLPTGGMLNFLKPIASTGTWPASTRVVAVGDLTGDGRGDVMARSATGKGWQVFPGDGNGHVSSTPLKQPLLFSRGAQVIPVGNWTGDSHNDVIVLTGYTHNLWLYPGNGKGGFGKGTLLARKWPYLQIAFGGSMTGNGKPSILGVANGTLYRISATGRSTLAKPVALMSMRGWNSLAGAGDLTGDGVGDVWLRQSSTGDGFIFPGDGHGGLAHYWGPYAGFKGLTRISAGQLSGASRPDILARTSAGRLVTFTNNQLTNTLSMVGPLTKSALVSQILSVGDWDGDGIPDLIARHGSTGNTLFLHRGLGGGRFAPGVQMPGNWKSITDLAAVGDITGTGRPSIVGRQPSGKLVVFQSDGKHGFLAPQLLSRTIRTYNQVAGAQWVSGNANSVLRSSDNTFVPFAGSPDPSTVMRRTNTLPMSNYDWVVGLGDVNGDGHPDLLVRQRSDGTLWLIPGTATGFGPRMFVTGGLGKYRLAG